MRITSTIKSVLQDLLSLLPFVLRFLALDSFNSPWKAMILLGGSLRYFVGSTSFRSMPLLLYPEQTQCCLIL